MYGFHVAKIPPRIYASFASYSISLRIFYFRLEHKAEMCFRFNRHVPLLDEDEGRESGRSELGHRCCGLTALRVSQ